MDKSGADKHHHSVKSDVIEGEVIEDETNESLSDGETVFDEDIEGLTLKKSRLVAFRENFSAILTEIGISRKQFILICVISVFFLSSLSTFIYFLFKFYQTDESSETANEKQGYIEDGRQFSIPLDAGAIIGKEKIPYKTEDILIRNVDKTFLSSSLLGSKLFVSDDFANGIKTSLLLGEENVLLRADRVTLVEYSIGMLARLNSLIEIDLEKFLSENVNRAEALGRYTKDAQDIFSEAKALQDRLRIVMEQRRAEFEFVSQKKDFAEKSFFNDVNVYSAGGTDRSLSEFIDLARRQSEIKAHFKAISKLKSLLDVKIVNITARLQAIELNKAALEAGIKVTPVEGSGVDLIENISD